MKNSKGRIAMTEQSQIKLNDYCGRINKALTELMSDRPALRENICEAMDYSLSAGGKRLRPVLMLEFCRMCGGDPEEFTELACSIELIHTFSLIHDDLPCMDDDDYRRGKPSCHKKYGEATALLAGDALNTLAFEVIADAATAGSLPGSRSCSARPPSPGGHYAFGRRRRAGAPESYRR